MTNGLSALDKIILVDKLAEYTAQYTELLSKIGFQKELEHFRELIEEIQDEIERRKSKVS